jgi:hypothetical protein
LLVNTPKTPVTVTAPESQPGAVTVPARRFTVTATGESCKSMVSTPPLPATVAISRQREHRY